MDLWCIQLLEPPSKLFEFKLYIGSVFVFFATIITLSFKAVGISLISLWPSVRIQPEKTGMG